MDRPEITAQAILDTATRLGITLLPDLGTWYDPATRRGCAAGVAALMLLPELVGHEFSTGELFFTGIDPEAACGLSDGFEGEPFDPPDGRRAADAVAVYRRHFRVGHAVAEAVAATPIGAQAR